VIRKSRTSDKKQIEQLIRICFGRCTYIEHLKNLNGRYYLYFIDDKLVAMSGINPDSEYPSSEIDWTCTHPDYRHKGIMQELFSTMFQNV
jgi:N-acetylglutamate synthase-like GNAT family acetyltransferase